MNFGDAIKLSFNNYANFNGRASRAEFWYFYLFTIIVTFCAGFSDGVLFGTASNSIKLLSGLVSLLLFIPSISVTVRRLHDVNKSGWYYLFFWLIGLFITILIGAAYVTLSSTNKNATNGIAILGVLGFFALGYYSIYLLVLSGTQGANKYGPDPLSDILVVRTNEPSFNSGSSPSANVDENLELLERLHALFKRGILSQEEFSARKKEILGINSVGAKPADITSKQSSVPSVDYPSDPQTNTQSTSISSSNNISNIKEEYPAKKFDSGTQPNTDPFEQKTNDNITKKTCKNCSALVNKKMMICPKCDGEEFI